MLRVILITLLFAQCFLTAPSRSYTDYIDASRGFFTDFLHTIYANKTPFFDFADGKPGKYYITDPHLPIEYDHYKYYWNETYMGLSGTVCEYIINAYVDRELGKTFYRNGTRATSLFYKCHWPYRCEGIRCALQVPLLPCFLISFIVLYCMYLYVTKELDVSLGEPIKLERTNVVTPECHVDAPPSYESTVESPPPSYEHANVHNVTYFYPPLH